MAVLLSNNATTTLASAINTSVTSLAINAADVAKFPSPTGGDWFPITVVDSAGNIEIMKCTARSGATLTVTRAQEATTAKSFAAGARVDLRLTVAAANELYKAGLTVVNTWTAEQVFGGGLRGVNLRSTNGSVSSEVDGNRHYWFKTAAGVARGVVYHDNASEAININFYDVNGAFVRSMNFNQNGIALWNGSEFRVGSARYLNDGNVYMPWAGDWLSNVLASKITTDGRAYPRRVGGINLNFNWNGQGGQPTWLWGGEDGTNMYVYNPSNFSVAYAANAGALDGLTTPGAVVSSGMASLAVGAIGTYAFLWNEVSEALNPGDTRPGSQLTYAHGNTQAAGTSPAGTWRLMGDCSTGSTTPRLSVWLRIS